MIIFWKAVIFSLSWSILIIQSSITGLSFLFSKCLEAFFSIWRLQEMMTCLWLQWFMGRWQREKSKKLHHYFLGEFTVKSCNISIIQGEKLNFSSRLQLVTVNSPKKSRWFFLIFPICVNKSVICRANGNVFCDTLFSISRSL